MTFVALNRRSALLHVSLRQRGINSSIRYPALSKSAVRDARRTCTYWATFNRPAEAGLEQHKTRQCSNVGAGYTRTLIDRPPWCGDKPPELTSAGLPVRARIQGKLWRTVIRIQILAAMLELNPVPSIPGRNKSPELAGTGLPVRARVQGNRGRAVIRVQKLIPMLELNPVPSIPGRNKSPELAGAVFPGRARI